MEYTRTKNLVRKINILLLNICSIIKMKDNIKYGTIDDSDNKDVLENLFISSVTPELVDNDDVFEVPKLNLDLTAIDNKTKSRARNIVERLSAYYFDQKYIDEHPYIPNKIAQEVDNIRRLLKMLAVNEKAQDTLITSIVLSSAKGTLYGSLTSLQNSMLAMQTQLNTLTSNLENIFREMQENCEKTFEEKDKDVSSEDGSISIRGSRDFIKTINNMIDGNKTSSEEFDEQAELKKVLG